MNMNAIMKMMLLVGLGFVMSCGPRYFEGAEVHFVQDETEFEIVTGDTIRYRASADNSHIYRLNLSSEDGDLTLGFPSDEEQAYFGDNVYINREVRIGFEDVQYTSTSSYNCDNTNETIEVTSNEYGLVSGTFAAHLCKRFSSSVGPERMLIVGTFAATVEESRW